MDWKTDFKMKKIVFVCIWILLVHVLCQKIYMLATMLLNLKLKAGAAGKGVSVHQKMLDYSPELS